MFTVGRHHERNSFNMSKKLIPPPKACMVAKLCDLKIYALSVLGYIGSISEPDDATLEAEAHALLCSTAGPYNAIPTNLLYVGSTCGLGPDLVGIHSVSLAARFRTAASSNTLNKGLEKIQAARGHDLAPIFALSLDWEEKFLISSMAHCTAEAFMTVVWTTVARLINLHWTKNKRLAPPCFVTNYLCKTLLGLSLHVLAEV